jgi:hypothetical protein
MVNRTHIRTIWFRSALATASGFNATIVEPKRPNQPGPGPRATRAAHDSPNPGRAETVPQSLRRAAAWIRRRHADVKRERRQLVDGARLEIGAGAASLSLSSPAFRPHKLSGRFLRLDSCQPGTGPVDPTSPYAPIRVCGHWLTQPLWILMSAGDMTRPELERLGIFKSASRSAQFKIQSTLPLSPLEFPCSAAPPPAPQSGPASAPREAKHIGEFRPTLAGWAAGLSASLCSPQ